MGKAEERERGGRKGREEGREKVRERPTQQEISAQLPVPVLGT